jgi:hypothetical protein
MHIPQFTIPEGVASPDPTKTMISSRKRTRHEQIFPSSEEWSYLYLWRLIYRWQIHDFQNILMIIIL